MKADKQAFQPPQRPYKRHSLAAVNAVQGKQAYIAKARRLRARLGILLRGQKFEGVRSNETLNHP